MSLDLFRLDGSVAIVTGSSKGIGAAVAKSLAAVGAHVVVCSRHGTEAVAMLAQIESKTGREGLAVAVDVSRRADVEHLTAETLRKFGKIDILVNNAAILVRKPFLEMTEEDIDLPMEVNYRGTYLCCQRIGQHMIQRRKGRVVNIASVAAIRGVPQLSGYAASKGAVLQLTQTLAIEWAPHNVLVNAICPGPFQTPMNEDVANDPKMSQEIVSRVPLARWGKPEELTGAVIFLASEAASFVTGSTIVVDGGRSIK
jgi:NAD(P)-dependent dehydrogenase (short-subunit alcohol dehydrogenase family)